MLQALDLILKEVENKNRYSKNGQISLFDDGALETEPFKMPVLEELPKNELLKAEKEVAGLYLSGHPMSAFEGYARKIGATRISDLNDSEASLKYDGKTVTVIGIINSLKRRATKSEQIMANIELEDIYGSIRCMVFPKYLMQYADILAEGVVVKVTARVSTYEGRDTELILESAETVNAEKIKRSVKSGLYLRLPNLKGAEYKQIIAVLQQARGNTPVTIVETDTGRRFAANSSLFVDKERLDLDSLVKILGGENVKLI